MAERKLKLCPVGMQTFEKVIENDRLYIDKTEYVYNLAYDASNYYFLSRPRRFGKSLLPVPATILFTALINYVLCYLATKIIARLPFGKYIVG